MVHDLLVSTDWLAEYLNDDKVKIVDIRGHVLPASEPPPHYFSHHDDYIESHIPNAVFVDWTSDIVEPDSPTYDIANPERYADLMSKLGIDDTSQVIVYDDANGMFAARFWWTMQYYGHQAVAVLDGGWQKWLADGHPISNEVPEVEAGTFTPVINNKLRATRLMIERDVLQLIDVRSSKEFDGEASRAKRMGHIPNAINMPRKTFLTAEGTLKSPDNLQAMFVESGISADGHDVVLYCNSGISASYGLLALRVAGITNGRVYDSSWKEWGNADDMIVE
ncbi:MAG: sulfurtransferase [Chloroflexota bacterium]